MVLAFPPPGYEQFILIILILLDVPLLLFAIATYRRFTSGDYKKFLLYYLIAGALAILSTFVRAYGWFNAIDPLLFRTIDHGIYLLALIVCIFAFKHTYEMTSDMVRLRGAKK